MPLYISPREFFQTYQPHGDKAKMYVSDTLNGSRFVTVDRVEYQNESWYLEIQGRLFPWDGSAELIIEHDAARTPHALHLPLFDWYVNSEVQRDFIGFRQELQDFFEDPYELREITVQATLARISNACDDRGKDDLIGDRLEVVSKLLSVAGKVDQGLYEEALMIAKDVTRCLTDLITEANEETKRISDAQEG